MNTTLEHFIGDKNGYLDSYLLPKSIRDVVYAPILTQGSKGKLLNFIATNIRWKGDGIWYEPFMGSGVVSFNIMPKKAVLSDINPHIIRFYNDIKDGKITPKIVRDFLKEHGKKLRNSGTGLESYYYEIRDKFNETGDPLYFLFCNHVSYNGLMRFNSDGKYNASFRKNPNRFKSSYITNIVNQVAWVSRVIRSHDFTFEVNSWENVVSNAGERDFVYMDPPYFGRNVEYFTKWDEKNQMEIVEWTRKTKSGYAISLWYSDRNKKNEFIDRYFSGDVIRKFPIYYLIGPKRKNKYIVIEALIIKKGYENYMR